jgi:hypothetical protein
LRIPNEFINVAVAEKLSALETEDFFKERAGAERQSAEQMLVTGKRSGESLLASVMEISHEHRCFYQFASKRADEFDRFQN